MVTPLPNRVFEGIAENYASFGWGLLSLKIMQGHLLELYADRATPESMKFNVLQF